MSQAKPTDGGLRDSPGIARLAMPAYHQRPAAPTNLTVHQAIDINVPIGCGDAPVFPGEALETTVFEDFVQAKVMEARSILGLYPPTDEPSRVDFAAWRKAQGR